MVRKRILKHLGDGRLRQWDAYCNLVLELGFQFDLLQINPPNWIESVLPSQERIFIIDAMEAESVPWRSSKKEVLKKQHHFLLMCSTPQHTQVEKMAKFQNLTMAITFWLVWIAAGSGQTWLVLVSEVAPAMVMQTDAWEFYIRDWIAVTKLVVHHPGWFPSTVPVFCRLPTSCYLGQRTMADPSVTRHRYCLLPITIVHVQFNSERVKGKCGLIL